MFDRAPDEQLVVDLVAAQAAAPPANAAIAAQGLIEELVAWQRVASWVESQRLDTMRRFQAARVAADRDLAADATADGGGMDLSPSQRAALLRLEADLDELAGKFAADEVALALNMSPSSASKQLSLAHDLHTVHRDLGEALQWGQTTPMVASLVAQATRKLPEPARVALDEAVTIDAVELPAGRAIDAARNRVAELSQYTELLVEQAHQHRYAYLKPLDDDQALLAAAMPAEDAVRAWQRLDTNARNHKRAGDPRTLDQLRCDLFADALASSGQPLDTATSPSQDSTDAAPAVVAGRPVSLQVVISLSTLLGLDSRGAFLDGYGTLTPASVRRIMATGDVTVQRLLCDPLSGAVKIADPTSYKPGVGLNHAATCRDRHCRMPVCGAKVRHLDHIQAAADAGLTTLDNVQGLCERSHLAKHHPGWKVNGDATTAITWTTPTDHRYTSLPPPATGDGTGPARPLDDHIDLPTWLSAQQILNAAVQDLTGAQPHARRLKAPPQPQLQPVVIRRV